MSAQANPPPVLFIATPAYGGSLTTPYVQSISALTHRLREEKIAYGHTILSNQSLVPLARNKLAAEFLASPATHLFFVDADVGFPADLVMRMLAADLPLVGALYPRKVVRWDLVAEAAARASKCGVNASAEALHAISRDYVVRTASEGLGMSSEDSPREVRAIGTGLMMIKRKVFEDMAKEIRTSDDRLATFADQDGAELREFFRSGCVELARGVTEHWPEDYAFCEAWTALGGKVRAVYDPRVVHFGSYAY